jgi:hypothetical protein
MTESVTRSRRMLLLLVALFFVPLAAAFLAYYSGWRPAGSTNHGELLQPIRQLPPAFAEPLTGKWALAWVGDGACDNDCQTALVFARQTRLSLAADTNRVKWVLLSTDHCCNREYLDSAQKGIVTLDAATDRAALLAVLPGQDLAHSLFVIDPLGNIVLRYDVRNNPRGLLEDIKKLLKLSHIG